MAVDAQNQCHRHWAWAAALVASLVFAAVYLPAVGRGFVRDDFAWIDQSRIGSRADFISLFRHAQGFYRPLVGLSFALDYALFGMHSFGYGTTNLFILLAAGLALFSLARRLGLAAGAAAGAVFLWLFNHHGINMALLWVSGRTSLLLSLFALLTALALLQRRRPLAACFYLLALFSKEDALLLPLALFLICLFLPAAPDRGRARRALDATWPLAIPIAVYFGLRLRTQAFMPFSAPTYYRLTLAPLRVLANGLQYLDRSAMFAVLVVLLLTLLLGRRPQDERGVGSPSPRLPFAAGMAWLACGLGLAVFLPVRSSLYAVYPGIGAALAAAALAQSSWRRADAARRHAALAAACILPLLLYPVLSARSVRWTKDADDSARIVAALMRQGPQLQSTAWLVLVDRSPDRRLAAVFGTLVQDAARLCVGRDNLRVWLEPPPADFQLGGLTAPPTGSTVRRLIWRDGRFSEEPDSGGAVAK